LKGGFMQGRYHYRTYQKRLDELKALALLRDVKINFILDKLIDDYLKTVNDAMDAFGIVDEE